MGERAPLPPRRSLLRWLQSAGVQQFRNSIAQDDGRVLHRFGVPFIFKPRTTTLTEVPDWDDVVRRLKRVFRPPERRLHLVGYSDPNEIASEPARRRLAQQRAELIRKELVARGVDPDRLLAEVGDAKQLRLAGYSNDLNQVAFKFDPNRPLRDDFEPNSAEYQNFCQ